MARYERHYDHTLIDPDRFGIKSAGSSWILYEKEFPTNVVRFQWRNGCPSISSGSILLSIPEVKQIAQLNGIK